MPKPLEIGRDHLVKSQRLGSGDNVALLPRYGRILLIVVTLISVCANLGVGADPSGLPAGQKQNETAGAGWSDVLLVQQPEPTISYRTGWVVYEESLTKGQFVGRGWNGAGFVSFYDGRIDPAKHPKPEAFWLEIDGQLLASDWQWVGLEKKVTSPGSLEAIVTLKHNVRPVTVKVHTKLDGTAILTRWLEITNTGSRPLPWPLPALGAVYCNGPNAGNRICRERICLCTR